MGRKKGLGSKVVRVPLPLVEEVLKVIARGRKRVAKEQMAAARSASKPSAVEELARASADRAECSFCGQAIVTGRDHRVSCPRYRRN
jgi:hypothetical protein